MKPLIKDLKRIEKVIKKEAGRIIGTEAVNHFSQNFDAQAFDGKKWKDVKRRDPASTWYGYRYGANTNLPARHPKRKGAKSKWKRRKTGSTTHYSPTAKSTPILSSQRSELENSLYYKVKGSRAVVIKSDKDYAQVHNKGGNIKVFGKHLAKIPARPFIGKSKTLNKKITKALNRKFSKQPRRDAFGIVSGQYAGSQYAGNKLYTDY